MNEIQIGGASFIGYEYLELPVRGAYTALCLDSYPCFGWTPDDRLDEKKSKGKIILRRDRKIINKVELTRLQRHFEACLTELKELEQSKTARGRIYAVGLGLIGCVFLALATFASVHTPPLAVQAILWGTPGFVCWGGAPFLYRTAVRRRSVVVRELMERKYDEIYELCEKGNALIN